MATLDQADLDRLEINIDAGNDWVEGDENTNATDATGGQFKTIRKINKEAVDAFNTQLQSIGFEPLILWVPSLLIDRSTVIVDEAGVIYAPIVSKIPFTTGAVFDPTNWFVIQQLPAANDNNIINGGFDRYIYGTSVNDPTSANEYNTADRWRFRRSGNASGMTVQESSTGSDAGDLTNCVVFRTNGDLNTDSMLMLTQIESIDAVKLQGKKVTLAIRLLLRPGFSAPSFNVRVSTGTGIDESISMSDGQFPTGNVSTDFNSIIDVGIISDYQTGVATFVVPSDATEISIRFTWTPSGVPVDTTDAVRFAYVNFVQGTADLSLKPLPFATIFEQCQRYARKSDVNTRVAEYTEEMRAAPAVSGSGPFLYEAEL